MNTSGDMKWFNCSSILIMKPDRWYYRCFNWCHSNFNASKTITLAHIKHTHATSRQFQWIRCKLQKASTTENGISSYTRMWNEIQYVNDTVVCVSCVCWSICIFHWRFVLDAYRRTPHIRIHTALAAALCAVLRVVVILFVLCALLLFLCGVALHSGH